MAQVQVAPKRNRVVALVVRLLDHGEREGDR